MVAAAVWTPEPRPPAAPALARARSELLALVLPSSAALLTKVASGSYHSSMRAIGLKVLKNKLSEYVRLVQGGETVLVTDRDRVVAELVPPKAGRSPVVADAVLSELLRNGWVTPPARPLTGPPVRHARVASAELMRELDESRADR